MLGQLQQIIGNIFAPSRPTIRASDLIPGSALPQPEVTAPETNIGEVQQLVGRVSELASSVAHDVGLHNSNVKAISDELNAVATTDPAAVAAIVCKLLLANQDLSGRLEKAEHTLQTHAKQLDEAVSSARTDSLTGLINRRAFEIGRAHV